MKNVHVVEILSKYKVTRYRAHPSTQVVITDGGEEFTDSAMDALRLNLENNSCILLPPMSPPSRDGHGAASAAVAAAVAGGDGDGGGSSSGARVALERLTWGEHKEFLERYSGVGSRAAEDGSGGAGGAGSRRGGFDYIVAADVICERVIMLYTNQIPCERERRTRDQDDLKTSRIETATVHALLQMGCAQNSTCRSV